MMTSTELSGRRMFSISPFRKLFSYGGRPKLHAQLARVDFDQAMTVARLASVSSELSLSEYSPGKAERLEALSEPPSWTPRGFASVCGGNGGQEEGDVVSPGRKKRHLNGAQTTENRE